MNRAQIRVLAAQMGVPERLIFHEQLQLAVLYELHKNPLSQGFMLRGGSALRLYYHHARFAEHLEFVPSESSSVPLTQSLWDAIMESLQSVFPDSYHFDSYVSGSGNPLIQRTTIGCQTPEDQQHYLQLDFVDRPACTTRKSTVQAPQGAFHLKAVPPQEILVDALLAMGHLGTVWAEVWDIACLLDQHVELDLSWIPRRLAEDGHAPRKYLHLLERRRTALQRPESGESLRAWLAPFLSNHEVATCDATNAWAHVIDAVLGITDSVRQLKELRG
ncbi:MAG: nucleotidyl transferase AbiEii/AbiGii toxin family protein [Firmicutes bacterium]|nr:nucleotidyl transferase AbiEii/AbiGii toxin family protein [Bacillota bacterium]